MIISLAWLLLIILATLHLRVNAFTVLELKTAEFPGRYHTAYGVNTSVKWRPGWSVHARVRVNWVEVCAG